MDSNIAKKKRRNSCKVCGPTENSVYRIPANESSRTHWIQFCKGLNIDSINTNSIRICGSHFEESCFCRDKSGNITALRNTAIPSIYTDAQLDRLKKSENKDYEYVTQKCKEKQNDFKLSLRKSFEGIKAKEKNGNEIIADLVTEENSDTINLPPLTPKTTFQFGAITENTKSNLDILITPGKEGTNGSDSTSTPINTPNIPSHVEKNSLEASSLPTILQRRSPNNEIPHATNSTISFNSISSTPSTSRSLPEKLRRHSIRWIKDIKTPDLETPRSRRTCISVIRHENKIMKSKLRSLKRQNTNLQKKVKTLNEALHKLQKENLLSSDRVSELLDTIPAPLREMILKKINNKSTQYTPELRKFAITLQFYSPRAYIFVRKSLCNILPSPSTIRKWCCVSNFEPGFSTEVLENLKRRNKPVLCSLMIDEMSIRQQVEFKHEKWYGFSNLNAKCNQEQDVDTINTPYAKSALVFLLVALNDSFKVPMGYYLIDTLSGKERGNLLRTALILANEHNINIHAVTFDGASVNRTMVQELGANLNAGETNCQPFIIHPVTLEKVYCFLDATHMIKNARNALGETCTYRTIENGDGSKKTSKKKSNLDSATQNMEEISNSTVNCKTMKERNGFAKELFSERPWSDSEGRKISFKYIVRLNTLQNELGLKYGNKLSDRHINYQDDIQRAKFAIQVLSNSVADALNQQKDVYKNKLFEECAGTSRFCEMMNRAYEILNVRSLNVDSVRHKYGLPLDSSNREFLKTSANEVIKYIQGLKDHKGTPLLSYSRKCAFVGLVICLRNIFPLFEDLQKKYSMKRLFTYKLQQDAIENFFSAIRSRGGYNNNPSAYQFEYTIRRLVVHHDLTAVENGNCKPDDLPILSISSRFSKNSGSEGNSFSEEVDNLKCKIEDPSNNNELPNELADIVTYIAGFIVRRLLKIIKESRAFIVDKNKKSKNCSLINQKNKGKLIYPSNEFLNVCYFIEKCIRGNPSKIFNPNFLQSVTELVISKFKNYFGSNSKSLLILKQTCILFLRVRLNHEAKYFIHIEKYVRKVYSKVTLFKGQ